MDPITAEVEKKPLKPFMVSQLATSFERERIVLSPYDEVLHKQLIDYEVDKISASGIPTYTSKNEHFVDALGLAHLAFVLEFPNISDIIKEIERKNMFNMTGVQLGGMSMKLNLEETKVNNVWDNQQGAVPYDPTEHKDDQPPRIIYNNAPPQRGGSSFSGGDWGSRSSSFHGRSNNFRQNTRSSW